MIFHTVNSVLSFLSKLFCFIMKFSFKISRFYYVKSICTRSFSSLFFPVFGLIKSRYSVRMWKSTDQKIFEYGYFLRSVSHMKKVCLGSFSSLGLFLSNEASDFSFATQILVKRCSVMACDLVFVYI